MNWLRRILFGSAKTTLDLMVDGISTEVIRDIREGELPDTDQAAAIVMLGVVVGRLKERIADEF